MWNSMANLAANEPSRLLIAFQHSILIKKQDERRTCAAYTPTAVGNFTQEADGAAELLIHHPCLAGDLVET